MRRLASYLYTSFTSKKKKGVKSVEKEDNDFLIGRLLPNIEKFS
jgi:hypothetical protein